MRGMTKFFFRLLAASFLALSNLAYAQDAPSDKESIEQKTEDFFDFDDAPVSYKGAFIKMILTLLGLVLLIVLSVWMLKRVSSGRMKQMNFGRSIKVIERRPISAKSVLYLVEIDGKKVVIAESQLEVRTIASADHLPQDED